MVCILRKLKVWIHWAIKGRVYGPTYEAVHPVGEEDTNEPYKASYTRASILLR